MNNREELKKHLAGICPPLQNLGNRAYQDVLADFITEQTRLARVDEVANCKIAHIDMHHGDHGEFDRWCTNRQERIDNGEFQCKFE